MERESNNGLCHGEGDNMTHYQWKGDQMTAFVMVRRIRSQTLSVGSNDSLCQWKGDQMTTFDSGKGIKWQPRVVKWNEVLVSKESLVCLGSCGISEVNDNHRIVGGSQAQSGEYPWQVREK